MKQKILLYCGNGYVFDEIYRPIVEKLGQNNIIDIIIADTYLSERVVNDINRLKTNGKIASYIVLPQYESKGLSIKYHKQLWSTMHRFKSLTFDLLILESDYYIPDKYLIGLAQSKGASILIISTGTMWRILQKYLNKPACGLRKEGEAFFIKGIIRKLVSLKRMVRNSTYIFRNHYLYPFIFTGGFFVRNKYDHIAFASGRADAVICYDAIEASALKHIIPDIKNVYHAQHPASNICAEKKNSSRKETTKLLVAFSGNLSSELLAHKYERWVNTIKKAIMLTRVNEVHMRFHPRMSRYLKWPSRIVGEIQKTNISVKVIDSLEVSLINTICDYIGVIGGSSGSLRVARAAHKEMFVVGLPNCSDCGTDDQKWILGNAEGIKWIDDNEEIGSKHLSVDKNSNDNVPSVNEIINRILIKKSEMQISTEKVLLS